MFQLTAEIRESRGSFAGWNIGRFRSAPEIASPARSFAIRNIGMFQTRASPPARRPSDGVPPLTSSRGHLLGLRTEARDPARGKVRQLREQRLIDGREVEARFALHPFAEPG